MTKTVRILLNVLLGAVVLAIVTNVISNSVEMPLWLAIVIAIVCVAVIVILEIWAQSDGKEGDGPPPLPSEPDRPLPTASVTPFLSKPYNLPTDVPDFVGRETETHDLLGRLDVGGVVGIVGMGGVGKTALAVHVAHQLVSQGRFKDAQLYIDLEGALQGAGETPLDPTVALNTFLNAVAGPKATRPQDVKTLSALWRQAIQDKDALLVLDNAASAVQVRPLLPGTPTCTVLVTSRRRFALPDMELMDLDRMELDGARALLQRVVPRLDGAEAAELADLCGRLPLALRLAGSYLRINDDCAPSEYVMRMDNEHQRLALLRDPDDPRRDVEAAIGLSVAQLDDDTRAGWAQLSLFVAPFDAQAAAALWDLEETAASDRLRDLRNRSLCLFELKNRRYELHDLVRLAASHYLEDDNAAESQQRLARHYEALAWQVQSSQRYLDLDADWPHLEAALEYAAHSDPHLLSDLAHPLASYWSARGMYREQAAWCIQASQASASLDKPEQQWIHLTHLGMARAALGNPEGAIKHYNQALALARAAKDHRAEATLLSNLGNAYADLGQTKKAIDAYQQALDLQRESGDRRGEGSTLGNLGIAYKNLGDAPAAIHHHQQALTIAQEIGDRRAQGRHRGNLGSALMAVGQVSRAKQHFQQALEIAQEIGDRQGQANRLGSLGIAYATQGDPQGAIGFFTQAFEIQRDIGDRRGQANSLGNLAGAYLSLGKERQAHDYFAQTLAIWQEIGDQRAEAYTLQQLGLLAQQAGDPTRARDLWQQALALYEAVEDPRVAQVRVWLDALGGG